MSQNSQAAGFSSSDQGPNTAPVRMVCRKFPGIGAVIEPAVMRLCKVVEEVWKEDEKKEDEKNENGGNEDEKGPLSIVIQECDGEGNLPGQKSDTMRYKGTPETGLVGTGTWFKDGLGDTIKAAFFLAENPTDSYELVVYERMPART